MIATQYANRKTVESYMTNFNVFDKVKLNIYNINEGELVEAESGYYLISQINTEYKDDAFKQTLYVLRNGK
jgi:hypothetical protein